VSSLRERFDRPVFIISSPRSGSTVLFDTLAQAPGLFSTGRESHGRIETVPGLSPADHGWSSNRLTAAHATPAAVEQLAAAFLQDLTDRDGMRPEGTFRMLEKTPKNALRVPFFDAAWPDSRFVYLYRDARETLSSMMEAWHSGRFRTYPRLPGWQGQAWSLLLVPGWRELDGRPLPEIVANQWAITTNQILDDLEGLPAERLTAVDYRQLLSSPQAAMEKLAGALDLDWDRILGRELPLSKTTVSRPREEKWREVQSIIESVWPIVEQAEERARAFIERMKAVQPK
jgi:hypothetical protein